MSDLSTALSAALGVYALVGTVFLISENRRPQATLAWMLVFIFAPGVGLLIYVLFGRSEKAFSKRTTLLLQELRPNAMPLLAPILADQDRAIAALEGESAARGKLMKLVRHNSHSALTSGNYVEILQDAAGFYPRLVSDIESARHSIHLQYFIWRSDQFTEKLKNLLTAKAREGIQVRLLYDPLGSHVRRAYVRSMQTAGVHMVPTSPRWQIHTISYRNHRKITVIDGVIGYTGGMNIGQEHLDGGRGFDGWRDTQMRVVGQAAAALQGVFLVDWYNAVKENLFSAEYFPTDATQPPEGDVPVHILTSGPDSQWAAIRQLYSFMIVSAQRHVFLQSPYFVLDGSIADALKAAALSGIDVRVMLSARASGNPLPNWAGNTYIAEVVRAGVRVFLYHKGYLHAKTISIDSEICSIGSANIDIRSFSINYELNAVLYCKPLAKKLEQDFQRDLEFCTEFNVNEYGRRNQAVRFRDSIARLLSPLL